jgi:hypothetical protein
MDLCLGTCSFPADSNSATMFPQSVENQWTSAKCSAVRLEDAGSVLRTGSHLLANKHSSMSDTVAVKYKGRKPDLIDRCCQEYLMQNLSNRSGSVNKTTGARG